MENNGSSDDRIASGKSDDVQTLVLGDLSSGNSPVAHISHMTVGIGRAAVVGCGQRIIMGSCGRSSSGRDISVLERRIEKKKVRKKVKKRRKEKRREEKYEYILIMIWQ